MLAHALSALVLEGFILFNLIQWNSTFEYVAPPLGRDTYILAFG